MDVNYDDYEFSSKIVYYGPGLSGKTTNLEIIYQKVPPQNKGELLTLATQQDRTLFFDFIPLDLGIVKGFKTKLRVFTVPGQVFYQATRKIVLQRVDGVVFVADSQAHKIDDNLELLQDLEDNLFEYGLTMRNIPIVMQYNKRDLKDILSIREMQQKLNPNNFPYFESIAHKGIGVFQTLKKIAGLIFADAQKRQVF